MKYILVLILSLISINSFALTEVKGHFNKKNNILTIQLEDFGFMPPYDVGDLYREMKGFDQSPKGFNRNGVKLECSSRRVSGKGLFGKCVSELDASFVKTGKGYFVFSLKGQAAFEIFREFYNAKSFSFSNSNAYLTMIPGSNQFFFGIKTSLVKVEY